MTRALAATLVLFAAIFAIAGLRYGPPAPRGLEVAPAQFSAARAREVQRMISADGVPRSIGSEANAKARAWLETELTRTGWKTSIQTAMSCSRHGSCARVNNVVATREGRDADAAGVLLMAHYDSVPCGPGASDDGMGTSAVMEAARAIAAGPQLRRTVVVVLTDGEEEGLLGAEAFVRSHPLAKRVHGAINIDARGTTGPSAMFETSAGNAWVVALLARHGTHPVTSSLFYEIYRRMPNDTDFTSVKDLAHGMNFANISRVEHYHTPLDSFENADPGTLQHHGDQALAMVRALADAGAELEAPRDRSRDAVWFDVLAMFIVSWPVGASLGLALAALALVLGWTIRMRAWGLGLLAPLAALVAAVIASLVIGAILRATGALPVPWIAHPLPALVALHAASLAAGLTAAWFVARRSSAKVAWAGTWLTWGTIGVLAAVLAPGASFLFVVPTFIAGFVAWLRIDLATGIPALAAAVLWMPLVFLVYDGLGLIIPVLASISSTLLVTTLPALTVDIDTTTIASATRWQRRLGIAAGAGVTVATVVALLVPKFSASVPQRVNVVVRQDRPEGDMVPPSRVYVEAAWAYMTWGKPPEPMLNALGDPSRIHLEAPTPWSTAVPFVESLPLSLPAPQAEVLSSGASNGEWNVRLRLRSPRGARALAVILPVGRRVDVVVDGQTAMTRNGTVAFPGVPLEGIEVAFNAAGASPIDLTLLDISTGVPEGADGTGIAQRVRAARPPAAVQTQEGDTTIVSRHVQL